MNFASDEDVSLFSKILDRAEQLVKDWNTPYPVDRGSSILDLHAVHANIIPLDLPLLLETSDANFGHDFFGIRRYLDRREIVLTEHFTPRCALRSKTTALVPVDSTTKEEL